MAEYIEREARYIDIKKVTIPRGFFNQDLNVPKLFDWLKSQPAADVVEVVRCKDCAIPHNRFTGCPKLNGLIPPENHYCGFGERKEGFALW